MPRANSHLARFAGLLALCLFAIAAAVHAQSATLIRNAAYFDGADFQPPADILIEDGRIAKIAPTIDPPDDAHTVDAEGDTLIPGLIDAHVHILTRDMLEADLRLGITTVLDMFTSVAIIESLNKTPLNRTQPAIADFRSAGHPATAPGGIGTKSGLQLPTIHSDYQVKPFIAARIEEGSDYIKIICEDGAAYGISIPTISPDLLETLITEAHAQGKLAIVHATTQEWTERAIRAGADVISHIFTDTRASEELIELAQESDVAFISAITLAERKAGPIVLRDRNLFPYATDNMRATLSRGLHAPMLPGAVENARANLLALHEAGVTILAGTDAPNPGTAHGISLHRELEIFETAGLSTADTLRAATSDPARIFNLDDRGVIAEGKRADLVLIEGDPRESILKTRAIRHVWLQGALVDRTPTNRR